MKACPYCAEDIQDAAIVCKHCHRELSGTPGGSAPPVAVVDAPPAPDATFNKDHYRRAFAKFDANGGKFAPTWNWGAFGFCFFWYLYRGMWAKGALIALVTIFTAGAAGIPFLVYSGLAGDYDFYLLKRRQTQLWK